MVNLIAEQNHRLILYAKPVDLPAQAAEPILMSLDRIGFIGRKCHENEPDSDYLPGERFMDLVTFLGCSPSLALSPEDGENYCFVRIHEKERSPVLYAGKDTPAPYCRLCQQARDDWQTCEREDFCKQCSLVERAENWQWRRRGVLSRWVIEIMNIYPHEAVPSPMLLDRLEAASGVDWGYAYLHAC